MRCGASVRYGRRTRCSGGDCSHSKQMGQGRRVTLEDFYLLPGDTPHSETRLAGGELITGVELPKSKFSRNSWYLKVRDGHSYAFALVSVAAGLELSRGVIQTVGLALGGVATKPGACSTWKFFLRAQNRESKFFDKLLTSHCAAPSRSKTTPSKWTWRNTAPCAPLN